MGRPHSTPRHIRPRPDDFADVAKALTPHQISKHYRCDRRVAIRWIGEMPAAWNTARLAAVRAEAVSRALKAKDAYAAKMAARKALLPPPPPKRPVGAKLRPMPDDFPALAKDQNILTLRRHYGCRDQVIKRWIAEMPAEWQAERQRVVKARMVDMVIAAQEKRLGRAVNRVPKDQRAAKQGKAPAKPRLKKNGHNPANWGTVQARMPEADGSTAGLAAQFLRRHYPNVFKAEIVEGKAGIGFYRVGRMRLSVNEMIGLAKDLGWDPESWKRVAA